MIHNDKFSFGKWIIIITSIKLIMFSFYTLCFHLYPQTSMAHGLLYVKGGDTFSYYPPLINFLDGGGYGPACRMPALIFPFGPAYIISGSEQVSYNIVIIFQFILSTLSVYFLGLISNLLFNNNFRIFAVTVISYSFWYHIGDHYLQADSIANSTLIFSFYFFLKSLKNNFNNKKEILYSGLFFTWTIFARVIAIVPFLALCVLIFYLVAIKKKELTKFLSVIFLFTVAFLICESAWVIRNKLVLNRTVLFTEAEECYSSFSYNWRELNKIPTAWGLETTQWAGEINWWLDDQSSAHEFPFSKNYLTKNFNADSLTKLKNQYWYLKNANTQTLDTNFRRKVWNYLNEYKKENPIAYYIINPVRVFLKFHFKKTIVDIPFPRLSEMNLFHKIFKTVNWLFCLSISLLFLISPAFYFTNKNFCYTAFIIVPFSISIFLTWYGVIEQRYFWPIIPFCIIFFGYLMNYIISRKKPR